MSSGMGQRRCEIGACKRPSSIAARGTEGTEATDAAVLRSDCITAARRSDGQTPDAPVTHYAQGCDGRRPHCVQDLVNNGMACTSDATGVAGARQETNTQARPAIDVESRRIKQFLEAENERNRRERIRCLLQETEFERHY